jgi:hypothetical protein
MLTSMPQSPGAAVMNTTTACLPRTIPLSRPWPLRWWHAASEALQSARAAWAEARRERAEQRIQAWDPGALAGLDDHVLRDIGAPDWVRAEAAVKRESERYSAALRASHLLDRGL